MKKRIKYIGMLACLMGGIFLFCIFYNKSHSVSVKDGITREDALEKLTKNEGYFMVRFSNYNTGLMYIISEGSDTGIEVELEGNTPLHSLSNVFRDSKNEFLIYGYEKNIEKKAKDATLLEDFPKDPYTIVVEDWEMITPIYRDYTYTSYSRMIYPKGYIDEYDLEHEDYEMQGQ